MAMAVVSFLNWIQQMAVRLSCLCYVKAILLLQEPYIKERGRFLGVPILIRGLRRKASYLIKPTMEHPWHNPFMPHSGQLFDMHRALKR